jgi:hypothetical protein
MIVKVDGSALVNLASAAIKAKKNKKGTKKGSGQYSSLKVFFNI